MHVIWPMRDIHRRLTSAGGSRVASGLARLRGRKAGRATLDASAGGDGEAKAAAAAAAAQAV